MENDMNLIYGVDSKKPASVVFEGIDENIDIEYTNGHQTLKECIVIKDVCSKYQ